MVLSTALQLSCFTAVIYLKKWTCSMQSLILQCQDPVSGGL